MAISSCGALVEMLSQHKLLAPANLAHIVRASKSPIATPRSLARTMLQRGWLTVYQINQLLAGRVTDLVFGPYHVLDRLGQGGQSMVFKARHTEFHWIVALKVIRSEILVTTDARQQFLQEMEAMAQLEHPNVVQFCDVDQTGDTYYCAMEYVEGTDLGKVVGLSGALPVPEACDYIRQTALGLQHAHEHSLVHRDIKPVNLFLTMPQAPRGPFGCEGPRPDPVIKILDWGLASLRLPGAARKGGGPANQVKGVIGTADYLSPEQAKSPHTVDIRGDIYSLGCTAYFLLTGLPPFTGGTLMQKLMRHQKEDPPALDELRADVPAALGQAVQRMMAKRPENRFQTPAAVALAMTPFCRLPTPPVDPTRPVIRMHFPAAHRRRPEDTPLPPGLRDHNPATHVTMTGTGHGPRAETDSTCP
jgi:serine/threonine-protein kinase